MKEAGCYFVNQEEKQKIAKCTCSNYTEGYGYKIKSDIPGQSSIRNS